MDSGIYTLIIRLDHDMEIDVGSLGRLSFMRGYYAYTGSARGPGGILRVRRHMDVLSGLNKVRRWHIDHILPFTSFEDAVVTYTTEDLECSIARKIGAKLEAIPGFGCTDCRCLSHLHFSRDLHRMDAIVKMAHGGTD